MKTQTTTAGIWEAREGHAIYWDRSGRDGALWEVAADLSVAHLEGPESSAPPMHIRQTARRLAQAIEEVAR